MHTVLLNKRSRKLVTGLRLAMKKRYRCTEILYVPNVLENRSVAIGIILWDPAEVVPLNMLNI